jgi:hypothetical protein
MQGVWPGARQEQEPAYQEIGELQTQKKKLHNEFPEEPSWAPAPAVVYGLITAKEVARYVPAQSVLVRPEKL